MYAVILAGGVGTRLWPRSRQAQPKQFADITGTGRTMIQATFDRVVGLVQGDQSYVVTGERYAALSQTQLPEIPAENIIVEPSGRNTAPAIGLACVHLLQRDKDAVLAVLPADHVILDWAAFQAALRCAAEAANQGYLVTLGIEPTMAHTGYGYIQRSSAIVTDAAVDSSGLPVYNVKRFAEKPNLATAEAFLAEGGYYWNGGIFIFRADVMMAEMARQLPELHAHLMEIAGSLGTANAAAQLDHTWARVPSVSIDYGIMEGAEKVAMVPLQAGWNDVGSWDALQQVMEPDEIGNYIANGRTLAVNSSGNIIYAGKKVVALIDVNDLVVVETEDALLLGNKHTMQKVKDVVEKLRASDLSHLL